MVHWGWLIISLVGGAWFGMVITSVQVIRRIDQVRSGYQPIDGKR